MQIFFFIKIGAKRFFVPILMNFFTYVSDDFPKIFKSHRLEMKKISDEKNWKIVFAYVSEHYASFGIKKLYLANFEGEVSISLIRNNPHIFVILALSHYILINKYE